MTTNKIGKKSSDIEIYVVKGAEEEVVSSQLHVSSDVIVEEGST